MNGGYERFVEELGLCGELGEWHKRWSFKLPIGFPGCPRVVDVLGGHAGPLTSASTAYIRKRRWVPFLGSP